MKRRIALLGAPASGKGTQAELIAGRYLIPATSTGAMLREEKRQGTELGLEAARRTDQGKLMSDGVVVQMLERWLGEHHQQFVLDGFPRTIFQADALERILADHQAPLEALIALEISLEQLQARVAHRLSCLACGLIVSIGLHVESAESPCPRCQGKLARRDDDQPETLSARLIEYTEKTEPLLAYYEQRGLLYKVDSSRTPELVFQSVSAILEQA